MTSLESVTSINRRSLHEQLTERLRDMIVEGALAPGSKVPERELCEKLGVSRTPMREALKVLAADGLLTLEPNRGARVRAITIDDLEEIFPLLGALESVAGELACQNITTEQLADLKTEHDSMVDHFQRSNMPEYFHHNQRIHEIIIQAANNNTLSSMYRSLTVRLRRARYMANMSTGRWQEAVDEHKEMIVALDKRDGKLLGEILRRHLENKFETVRKWILEQQTDEDKS